MSTENKSEAGNTSTPLNVTPKEIPFAIPVEGSLGLLALGDIGIREWRKVREAAKKSGEK